MKILLLNRAFYPDSVSTSQHVTDLAHELQAQGHQITVLCGQRDYTQGARVYPRFEVVDGINVHRVASTWFGKQNLITRILDASTYDLMSLWRLIRLPRHDLVVAFTSPPLVGLHGVFAARIWRARFVHWLMNINHEMALEMGYLKRNGLLSRVLTGLYRFTLRASDRVVVMDEFMKARVERARAIDPQKIVIVPLWAAQASESDHTAIPPSTNPFREKYGLADKFVVAHSGNLSYIHPLDTVLDAIVALKDDPSIVFVFIGYGAREQDIDERVRRDGLTNVLRLPYQPRELLGHSLGLADLHLIVMGNATSGLAHASKIYSILASGRPFLLVGPRASHIMTDFVARCEGGFQVENGDVDGVLAVIEKVRQLPVEERARIDRMNRAYVAAQFSRERCVARFSEQVIAPLSAHADAA